MTGGAGFIGSQVVKQFSAGGYDVIVLDKADIKQVIRSAGGGRVRYVRGDLRDRRAVRVALAKVDTVIHLASPVSVPLSFSSPKITREVIVEGTQLLLEESLKCDQVANFIYFSSSAVYGEARHLPIDEEHPKAPNSPYATAKLEAERLCLDYSHRGMRLTILRPFNIYGPRQESTNSAAVVPAFIEAVRRRMPPQIFGDGSQTRDFVYVDDVSAILKEIVERGESLGILNLGTGQPNSVRKLAEVIIEISGHKLTPIYLPRRNGDINSSYADTRLLEKSLGKIPRTSFIDGIKRVWEEWQSY